MANEEFERWYKQMAESLLAMAKKIKDPIDSQTANDFIESHADLEEAFEAGQESCIRRLEETMPYPKEVFLPRTDKQMKEVATLLKKNGLSPDGIFGHFGREVWNNAISKLKEK